MDVPSLGAGGVLGIGIWELAKQLFGLWLKQKQGSIESSKRLLREDIECLAKLILEMQENSVRYYDCDFTSDTAKDLSRQIKAKSKTAGIKLTVINSQLSKSGGKEIPVRLWTVFKTMATKHLDVKRHNTWSDDDPRLTEIYKATNQLHTALNDARYSAT